MGDTEGQGRDMAANKTVRVSALMEPRVGRQEIYNFMSVVVMAMKGTDRLSCPSPTLPGAVPGGLMRACLQACLQAGIIEVAEPGWCSPRPSQYPLGRQEALGALRGQDSWILP